MVRAELLWPTPRRIVETGGALSLAPGLLFLRVTDTDGAVAPSVDRLAAALPELGIASRREAPGAEAVAGRPTLALAVEPGVSGRKEGYRLAIGPSGIRVEGDDEAGVFYGVCTLLQWIALHRDPGREGGLRLPGIEVRDWPDYPHRGVLLDVSRDKVPTLETLFAIADVLAGWKVNQLQLYTENAFAYRGHEVVWKDASPLTPEEVRRLDAHCRERFIELVPNQNSFGHFHRWLVHEPYRGLAECPEGVRHPFSDRIEPFSLCPTDPGSLDLLADLYDQLLPNFGSRLFNAGLDETFDLGACRSRDACRERGEAAVYLDFLRAVHRLVTERAHRMQFWADIVLEHPETVPEIPRDAIPLVWGYEADHPFAEQAARLAAARLDFYVCPGTSSWSSFAGRTTNALLNLGRAAAAGRAAGASGYLVTDWGDFGHLQPFPVSYLGLLAGAGFAWNAGAGADPLAVPIAELLDRHAFFDHASEAGAAARDLGDAYRHTGTASRNGSALFFLVIQAELPLDHPRLRGLSRAGLERALETIEGAAGRIGRVRMERADAALVRDELEFVAGALTLGCRIGLARLRARGETPLAALPRPTRRALARDLGRLAERHRAVWHARNRPGGLADSAGRLERVRRLLE